MFANLFARRGGVEHDAELLYLACILHDIGLTDRTTSVTRPPSALRSRARGQPTSLLCRHGEHADRARTVAEAISLHLNITVPKRMGGEAHLLNKGAMVDVVGRYARELPRAGLGNVLKRWPRDELAEGRFLPSLVLAASADSAALPRVAHARPPRDCRTDRRQPARGCRKRQRAQHVDRMSSARNAPTSAEDPVVRKPTVQTLIARNENFASAQFQPLPPITPSRTLIVTCADVRVDPAAVLVERQALVQDEWLKLVKG